MYKVIFQMRLFYDENMPGFVNKFDLLFQECELEKVKFDCVCSWIEQYYRYKSMAMWKLLIIWIWAWKVYC